MNANTLATATQWITALAVRSGEQLPQALMQRLDIKRAAATALLRQLVDSQWLEQTGTTRRPSWQPGVLRQVVQTYPLAGLAEDLPWSCDFAPYFDLRPNVARLVQHAFSELLNNAIEHSGGTAVTVSMRQTGMHVQLLVSDDGCGVFQRIAEAFEINDPTLAMFELTKGKLTSAPAAHNGHGLFFTSRLADFFNLHANEAAFQLRNADVPGWVKSRPLPSRGTSVYLAIALDTSRSLDAVLQAHSIEAGRYVLDRTVLPVKLLTSENVGLESRAQARRVVARLALFRQAEVDFEGVAEIGHAFADELFRVQAARGMSLDLRPVGMSSRVQAMVESVLID